MKPHLSASRLEAQGIIAKTSVGLLSAFLFLSMCGPCLGWASDRKEQEENAAKKVEELLATLKRQQDNQQAGQDPWALTMKELIELGPDAVPALSRILIDTPVTDRRMLRSLPFVLRGIGDKRAVPALIQTLPKCNFKDGSDMGYDTKNADLLAFMRRHDDDLDDRDPKGYNWGRPINEVRTALNKLTGTAHGEIELCHVHGRTGTPRQQHLKEVLFIRCAERWSNWWQENWRDHITDETYSVVHLPSLKQEDDLFELKRDVPLTAGGGMSNMMCEPLRLGQGNRVFYDVDTGRFGSVHSRWKEPESRTNEQLISKWAASQGFDLMGSQIEVHGKTVFILKLISGDAWELPFEHWQNYVPRTADELIRQGTPVQDILAVRIQGSEQPDYPGTGLFFWISRHGTPALIRLGIEVHDNTLKPGLPSVGDNELNPRAFRKGRRFAVRLLNEVAE